MVQLSENAADSYPVHRGCAGSPGPNTGRCPPCLPATGSTSIFAQSLVGASPASPKYRRICKVAEAFHHAVLLFAKVLRARVM